MKKDEFWRLIGRARADRPQFLRELESLSRARIASFKGGTTNYLGDIVREYEKRYATYVPFRDA